MQRMNEDKAKVLYDFLDGSKMFTGTVEPGSRSLMNIPFITESKELDAEVVAATKAAGFDNLKGHKSVGGLRASIYNAMPKDGVIALVDFLKSTKPSICKPLGWKENSMIKILASDGMDKSAIDALVAKGCQVDVQHYDQDALCEAVKNYGRTGLCAAQQKYVNSKSTRPA